MIYLSTTVPITGLCAQQTLWVETNSTQVLFLSQVKYLEDTDKRWTNNNSMECYTRWQADQWVSTRESKEVEHPLFPGMFMSLEEHRLELIWTIGGGGGLVAMSYSTLAAAWIVACQTPLSTEFPT